MAQSSARQPTLLSTHLGASSATFGRWFRRQGGPRGSLEEVREEKFKDFWPKDEFGKRAIGASARGLCMFRALKRAAELAGRPDIITQDDIDTFVADELREHWVDLTRGTSWKVVLRFLRRLRDADRDFIFKTIDKDNFTVAGRVQGKKGKVRRIYDLKEPKPVSSASDWITFVACIRPFIVFKKK
ncbi:hypothetical protein PR003_g146 [Phytophthora rubi]|uniref:Uncharacterized protein n=1 Tax=Phytophthora rubi TaxID=129364 RepID=A0A6A3P418_9STRA|nr:hypothetical protein PR002_g119 [Phytophthora rubi]KAE9052850.1 hypothetical protein PR001_g146 [Phytophthora rubi]KAE9360560.1 hypothetical protein PR003_g146 [Phytophthora rubi]